MQWLEKQLLSLENPNSTDEIIIPDTMRFDTALKKQLIQFQTKHGLRADGVAGQQTIMMINQLRDSSIPLLTDDIDMTLVKNAGEK